MAAAAADREINSSWRRRFLSHEGDSRPVAWQASSSLGQAFGCNDDDDGCGSVGPHKRGCALIVSARAGCCQLGRSQSKDAWPGADANPRQTVLATDELAGCSLLAVAKRVKHIAGY